MARHEDIRVQAHDPLDVLNPSFRRTVLFGVKVRIVVSAIGRDDVAGMRTTLGDGRFQHRLQRAIQAIDLRRGEAIDPRQG